MFLCDKKNIRQSNLNKNCTWEILDWHIYRASLVFKTHVHIVLVMQGLTGVTHINRRRVTLASKKVNVNRRMIKIANIGAEVDRWVACLANMTVKADSLQTG